MRILIYGYRGWIGQQFVELLNKEQITYHLGLERVENIPAMQKELDTIKPTHVISFIGRTHGSIGDKKFTTIDYLEQPGKLKENVRDNLFSPLSLALACKSRGIHYTYLGTGCIFNYLTPPLSDADKESSGFREDDLPNFFGSGYSCVKGFTDMLMHQLEDSVLNLRIRMPIIGEDNPRNFITKITHYEKICSIPNSMSVLSELLPFIINFMRQCIKGTINLTNPGTISHDEILEMYKEYVDPNFTWQNFSIEEQNKILASERSNNLLDTTRLQELEPRVKHIKESVKELLQKWPKVDQASAVQASAVQASAVQASAVQASALQHQQHPVVNNKILISENSHFPDIPSTLLFVTGGSGFIGSNFNNELFNQYQHIKVINFDALYYCANEEQNIKSAIRNNKERYTFIHGNLQSLKLLNYIFQTNPITHIVHFAAQSHVQTSFTDAIQYTKDNVLGTHHLLEATRLHCPTLQKFIHVSTDEVYGQSMLDLDEAHKTEQSLLCPTNPYAATKCGAEMLAQSYNHSFKMPIIITRGNNVYGPNQYTEKVIPRFIEQLKNDEKITIQGDGSCVRAFLHAYDTATAFITILEKGKVGEIYNIGCDKGMEYSILDVAKILIKKMKNTDDNDYEKWITFVEDRPFNDQRYYISNYKLKELGWNIKIQFLEGIEMLV
jgi:dTDP-glucose 4,6-dehydratase